MPMSPSWSPAPRGAPKLEPESSRGLAREGMAEAEFRVLTSGLGPRQPGLERPPLITVGGAGGAPGEATSAL